ncbi:MAG: YggS family pyridoxal phosphate-dependent enzyme [Planctomycetia bacterium]|nr:YggS family pyridoxal phosphate-dependent enzyme [Planctomycetia bacterium]
MSDAHAERIVANLASVRERIAAASIGAGRLPAEVRLVAVTKYVDLAATKYLIEAGCLDLGEARPQKLWDKAAALDGLGVRWHLIGQLQRNKVRRTLPLAHLIHAGDSERLLAEIEREAAALELDTTSVLLEVNVSGDVAKHGFAPKQLEPLLDRFAKLPHVAVRGLMTMAGLNADADGERRQFAELRELRNKLRSQWSGRFAFDELSMGMSGDFEAAIAEGATMVRVGSALFEGIATGDAS